MTNNFGIQVIEKVLKMSWGGGTFPKKSGNA